jgi:hypothetical protein
MRGPVVADEGGQVGGGPQARWWPTALGRIARIADESGRAHERRQGASRGTQLAWVAGLVPSFPHEIVVELFRNRGELARELLRECAELELDAEARAESASVDLSQVVPVEYRADHVTLFRNRKGAPSFAVVVEVQRRIDARKRRTWPIYLTCAAASLGCPTFLLVIAPSQRVARWARAPIAVGHPGFELRPIAVAFDEVPQRFDLAVAARTPELAVLSAMAHGRLELAELALHAIRAVPSDLSSLYFDVILSALPPVFRRILEAHMKDYVYQSSFARKYVAKGLEQGLEQGREEGRRAALELARAKLGELSSQDRAVIAEIHDGATLTALILGLGKSGDREEARAAFDRAIHRRRRVAKAVKPARRPRKQ